jgi:hypothetical protein
LQSGRTVEWLSFETGHALFNGLYDDFRQFPEFELMEGDQSHFVMPTATRRTGRRQRDPVINLGLDEHFRGGENFAVNPSTAHWWQIQRAGASIVSPIKPGAAVTRLSCRVTEKVRSAWVTNVSYKQRSPTFGC